jgi:exopolysaccharide biosynthesis protein
MEDSRTRPFMAFDENSNAKYYSDTNLILKPKSEMYNVIWGRFDLLVNGKIAISNADGTKDNLYPRTIVGIDKTGSRMFLLVVDGRKPQYSKGMNMQMCAKIIQIVGSYDAMACDQGGSSMMYSKTLGVVNRPADGVERVVYTHLGFKSRK